MKYVTIYYKVHGCISHASPADIAQHQSYIYIYNTISSKRWGYTMFSALTYSYDTMNCLVLDVSGLVS